MSEKNIVETESLCVNCQKNGKTLLYLTNIPYFKDVVITSFECPHCHYTDRYIHSADSLNEKGGCRIQLKVSNQKDLNRQLVISEHSTFIVPHLGLEIPALKGNQSSLTTVEGKMIQIKDSLLLEQPERRQNDPELADKLDEFIKKVEACTTLKNEESYEIIIDDPSGNSFIEPIGETKDLLNGMESDKSIILKWYPRTNEQIQEMGFIVPNSKAKPRAVKVSQESIPYCLNGWDLSLSVEANLENIRKQKEEGNVVNPATDSVSFAHDCPQCGKFGLHQMCDVHIPGFRQCLIMAFNCSSCGFKNNEIKPMGEIGAKAKKWILHVETVDDLNRDVLKSEASTICIPDLELQEVCTGTVGGVFTTIEGLISKMADQLENHCAMFMGDSASPDTKTKIQGIIDKLKKYCDDPSALPFTLILDDPTNLSVISHRYTQKSVFSDKVENQEDDQLKTEEYERTTEQNEELGLLDMKTENYD